MLATRPADRIAARIIGMDRLRELRARHEAAERGGGEERRGRQHQEGKLSARERIDLLLDEGTFEELDHSDDKFVAEFFKHDS